MKITFEMLSKKQGKCISDPIYFSGLEVLMNQRNLTVTGFYFYPSQHYAVPN